ncbi:MAG: M17 family metallopeptidase [Alphaproteobacteria bacterium]
MVYSEPNIKNFVNFVDKLFYQSKSVNTGVIYFVSYKPTNNKLLPKDILNFYTNSVTNHKDGKIIYLNRKKKFNECIVLYGKCEYKTISKTLGSLVSYNIDNGTWKIFNKVSNKYLNEFLIGWGLDQYNFNSFKVSKVINSSSNINIKNIKNKLTAIFYGKELINIPASDMGPDALEKSFISFADYHNADLNLIKNNVLKENFPLIYAVGKCAIEQPRLLELNIGKKTDPQIILIGKGVCFDTGGLDLKPSQYMRNMKKDMGGAASILSLAHMVITSKLKVNLKVLIPTVNNDIGPSAMKPGDVYNSKAGITVEIGNTDAEGRLILADALFYADSFKPKVIIDFATLTGAARVALGPDLPAYFTNHEAIASMLNNINIIEKDPLWRLPLYSPYSAWLDSEVADTNNISQGPFAGSITAALFLNKFVKPNSNWVHIDTYAWSDTNKPGHSKGGDILGAISLYKFIKDFINSLE